MTYAEICTYLTTEYTAQYPDQTEDKIQGMVRKRCLTGFSFRMPSMPRR